MPVSWRRKTTTCRRTFGSPRLAIENLPELDMAHVDLVHSPGRATHAAIETSSECPPGSRYAHRLFSSQDPPRPAGHSLDHPGAFSRSLAARESPLSAVR